MAPVLVTGAAGFAGQALVAALRADGREVVGAGHATDASVDFRITEDVLALVDEVRPSLVFHLAGTSTLREMLRDPHGGNYNVVQPAVNLMEALARVAPGTRLVLCSPCEVYGRAARLPTDERSPLAPVDVYGAARAAVEYMSRSYAQRDVPVIVARAFHFTGPGQDRRWPLADLVARAALGEPLEVGNPELRRDYSDVRDIVRGLAVLGDRGEPGEAYNLCSGSTRSLRDLAAQALGEGAELTLNPDLAIATEVPVFLGSPARAEALGWRREWTLERTLADLRASYR
ncbi:MAG: NAD-dependent epimerase/dehydratase family protein [Pseudomonadota bacterium]|nr:NAD-dependent epimerase/dehydratase family protein [Pseudomonadota bacterium]